MFRTEKHALSLVRARLAKGTILDADESASWNDLHARFEMKRIDHEEAYSLDGARSNWAEEFFSRMRRAEIGHHDNIAGAYLLRYAREASPREDNLRDKDHRKFVFRQPCVVCGRRSAPPPLCPAACVIVGF